MDILSEARRPANPALASVIEQASALIDKIEALPTKDAKVSVLALELFALKGVDLRETSCSQCGSVFITGPGTGRYHRSVYCSDRCRVAAQRARAKLA